MSGPIILVVERNVFLVKIIKMPLMMTNKNKIVVGLFLFLTIIKPISCLLK